MVNILNELNTYLNVPALTTDMTTMIAVVVTLVIAFVCCFFGYKSSRGIAAVVGFLAGAAGGRMIAQMLKLESPIDLVVVLAAAIIVAILSGWLVKVGIFLIVLLGVWGAVYSLLTEYTSLERVFALIAGLVAAAILAVLAVIYMKPMIIVATAVAGGLLFADTLFQHLIKGRWSAPTEMLVRLGVGALLVILGMIVQFASTRRRY